MHHKYKEGHHGIQSIERELSNENIGSDSKVRLNHSSVISLTVFFTDSYNKSDYIIILLFVYKVSSL